MKGKLENYLMQEEEIKQAVEVIQKDPMTHCDTSLIRQRITELDALEKKYRELFSQIMKKPEQLVLRTFPLPDKSEQELCLNFDKNIKWIWEVIKGLNTQIKQINLQKTVIFETEMNNVFDLDSIEKRLSLSQERDSLFYNPNTEQQTKAFTIEHNEEEADQQDYDFLPNYFKESMKLT